MIYSLYIFLVLGLGFIPLTIDEGKKHFSKHHFIESAKSYELAIKQFPKYSRVCRFNAAQAWLNADSMPNANSIYNQIQTGENDKISSNVLNNYGVNSDKNSKTEEALAFFKDALRRDPENEIARYNYELLKKKNSQNQQQDKQDQQQQQQQDKNSEDQKSGDKGNNSGQGQGGNKPTEQQGNKSQAAPVSKQQAKQLLQAMKQNEKKFLQQLKKKVPKKPENDGDPDW